MLRPGAILCEKYRVCHLVAQGGTSEVYLVELLGQSGDNRYALKRLQPALQSDSVFVSLFEAEAKIVSDLNHRNIVNCYEVIKDQEDLFIIMEFVSGRELASFFSFFKQLSLAKRTELAFVIGRKIASALAYLHCKTDEEQNNLDIVHCDVSTKNIIITADADVKLYDFGASKTNNLDIAQSKNLVLGNFRYMSPEQLAGGRVDAASDVYSLAIVLLEIINGTFIKVSSRSAGNSILQMINKKNCLNSSIANFFTKCLDIEKKERFSSGLEMIAEIDKIISHNQFDEDALLSVASNFDIEYKKQAYNRDEHHFSFIKMFLFSISALFIVVLFAIGLDLLNNQSLKKLSVVWPSKVSKVGYQDNNPERVSKTGYLLINAIPWADVFIDGKFVGTTPIETIELPIGDHLIQFENPEMSEVFLKEVKIYPNQKIKLNHKF